MTGNKKWNFPVDEKLVTEVVSAALLKMIDADARDTMIKEAITYLLTAPKGTDYRGLPRCSPLQEKFRDAINQKTYEIIREEIENSPVIQQKIKDIVMEAFEIFMKKDSSKIAHDMADRMTDYFHDMID